MLAVEVGILSPCKLLHRKKWGAMYMYTHFTFLSGKGNEEVHIGLEIV